MDKLVTDFLMMCRRCGRGFICESLGRNALELASWLPSVIVTLMGGACSVYGRYYEKCVQNCTVKPKGKRPLGRRRSRWEDIRIYLMKIVGKIWTGFNWLSVGTSGELL
jgi:hypothetical protein